MKIELKFKIIVVCILAAIAIAANIYEDYMVYGEQSRNGRPEILSLLMA